jgi:squalene-hopene/tetraprenyl-beta-curcumene cyclase
MAIKQQGQHETPPLESQMPLPRQEAVKNAIARTQGYLLATQSPEGWWCGELESNGTITAEYLFLTHFLGVGDSTRWEKIANYLREQQRDDGTWGIYYDAPGDLSTTIEAYLALKMAGDPPDAPHMTKAREFILSAGGIPRARIFTKIWLALLGQYDWRRLPVMPPELIFLPSWVPGNIYDFACWARGTIVPMFILLTDHPARPVPPSAEVSELFPTSWGEGRTAGFQPAGAGRGPAPLFSWRRFFLGADKVLRRLEQARWKPLRRAARRACERWMIAHQEADGSWGGIQPPWVYSLLALATLGRPVTDPLMVKGLRGFEDFAIEDARTFRTQSCMSPVWDTALAATALLDSGLAPGHPALVKTARWLMSEQIFSGGDWQVKQKRRRQMGMGIHEGGLRGRQAPGRDFIRLGGVGRPGGWAFEFQNDLYPDTDDSSEVLLALNRIALPEQDAQAKAIALDRGTKWLLGMQSKNGGFASFDIDNTRRMITQIPFCDFGEVIDPPSEDVTAHILEWFGARGLPRSHPQIAAALRYLKREQCRDGSWWGRWGVNHIYGTGAVLPALRALGEDMRQNYIQRAGRWLLQHQQDNGGWGESCQSYDDPNLRGVGVTTASQTAWALLGLLAIEQGGGGNDKIAQAIEQGIEYLLMSQSLDGTWNEPYFTGTGFPRAFMIKYHLYRIYFPLMALGRYWSARCQ